MATVLALPGLAKLLSVKDVDVVLAFDGLRYGPNDVVPTALLTVTDCPGPPCTAGEYVAHCMTRQFGADQAGWPPLAQNFVSEATPPPRG